MARRNRSESEAQATESTEATTSTATEEPPAGAEATGDTAAEGSEKKEEKVIDLNPFKTAAQGAVDESDTSTGVIPDSEVEKVVVEYRNLDGAKAKNQAKSFLNDQMKDAMASMDIVKARAFLQLTESMTAGAGKVEKAPADPTEAHVQRVATLNLAQQLVGTHTPEGVADDWQDRVNRLVEESSTAAQTYLDWLNADEESRGDEPDVSSVVKNAVKLSQGKAAKAGSRASSGGTFTGERRDIGKHILEAFADRNEGDFLTVAEIRKFRSEEYGDNPPSAGAISARLFPQSGKCTLVDQGIKPDTNEKGNKGATKVAPAA